MPVPPIYILLTYNNEEKKIEKWIVSNFQKTSNDAHEIFLPFKKPRESTMRI